MLQYRGKNEKKKETLIDEIKVIVHIIELNTALLSPKTLPLEMEVNILIPPKATLL